MSFNLLWAFWVAQFVIYETLGYFHFAGMNPLTHYFRLYALNPRTGWLVAGALGWFAYHIFIEPFLKGRK